MKRHTQILSLVAVTLWISGCVGTDDTTSALDDAGSIQQALEQPNGDFDTEDTAPMFGEDDVFADIGVDEEYPAVEDEELAFGPDGRYPIPDDVRGITVVVQWGQPRPNPDVPVPTVWDGDISVSDGGLIVRRVLRFEDRTDMLLPRFDPQTVFVRSVTQPHNDGLILTLVPPRPDDAAGREDDPTARPPALVVSLGDVEDIVVPIRDLADGFRVMVPVDRMGNVIVIATVPDHPCPAGMLAGVWRQVEPGLGNFRGRWIGLEGELLGHLQGIYGTNEAGEQVFFGKFIDRDGRFHGLLRGVWGDGTFSGRWVDREGRHIGGLRGDYRVGPAGEDRPADGVFAGHWIEACGDHRCDAGTRCPGEDPESEMPEELL
jgi:hypothetical protein